MKNGIFDQVGPSARNWIELWNGSHPLWLNDRHLETRCRIVTDDILRLVSARTNPVILDYGCGEAIEAHRLAAISRELFLYDAPPEIFERVRKRFAGAKNVRVVDSDQVAALASRSIDVIILSSVIQYLTEAQFESLLVRLFAMLRDDGEILIGDVIVPGADSLNYAWTLVRDGVKYGYFWAAIRCLLTLPFSHYWRLKRVLKYTYYTEENLRSLLKKRGFDVERLPFNIGGNQGRLTFRAWKASRPFNRR